MKIRMDDRTYVGSPEDIVSQLRNRDHGQTNDLDSYMKRVASSLDFKVEGNDISERCESFLSKIIQAGFAKLVRSY